MNSSTLETISQLKIDVVEENNDDEKTVEQIMVCRDDYLFIWSKKHQHVLAVRIGGRNEGEVQTLLITATPLFEVERMAISHGGRWIALSGPRGVSCVELPRRYGKDGLLGGGNVEITCRTVSIAERFFACQHKLVIQQVNWHPGSVTEAHLVVLASDNYIRVYNLDDDDGGQTPERSVTIRAASLFGTARFSVKSSLGETAVSFCFAPPVNDPDNHQEWPIFVLLENGAVYCLVAPLKSSRNVEARVLGPIPIFPENEDDGSDEDFCSILCLHPMIASPPVIVTATTSGTIYHYVVLHNENANDETSSQVSDWSTTTMDDNSIELSLYTFESVELELGLRTFKENELKRPFNYSILFHPDPMNPGRYFCSHGAGAHCVGVPMVTQLAKMANSNDLPTAAMEQECIVDHLICTRMSSSCPPAPILGLSVAYQPARLLCLLSNYRVETLNLNTHFSSPPPLYTLTESSSPLKKSNREPFEAHVRKMCQKNSCHPLIKSAKGTDLNSQECLEILTRSTQVLREEYLTRLELVRRELEKKVGNLHKQKKSQTSMVIKLESDKKLLRENAGRLAERYEDIKDVGDRLNDRIEVVLQKIQRQLPISSDSELAMQRDLREIEKKLKDLKFTMEQVKSKEKYQLRQIKRNEESKNWRNKSATGGLLGDNQIESVKEILAQDSSKISEMVKIINACKKDLAM